MTDIADLDEKWRHDLNLKLVQFVATGECFVATEGVTMLHLYGYPKSHAKLLEYEERDQIRPLTDSEVIDQILLGAGIIQVRDGLIERERAMSSFKELPEAVGKIIADAILNPQHIIRSVK